MPIYFAYGSNLLHQRLQRRCPGAVPLGRAEAVGWRVEFTKLSWMDGSGKATIAAGAGVAEGVLYELPRAEIAVLDAIEGVGKGYDRIDGFRVTHRGAAETAITYIASEPRPGHLPFDWYLGLVLAGALQNGLGDGTINGFRSHPRTPDPDAARAGHLEANDLLVAHVAADWRRHLFG